MLLTLMTDDFTNTSQSSRLLQALPTTYLPPVVVTCGLEFGGMCIFHPGLLVQEELFMSVNIRVDIRLIPEGDGGITRGLGVM
jgi:hypothetical protein